MASPYSSRCICDMPRKRKLAKSNGHKNSNQKILAPSSGGGSPLGQALEAKSSECRQYSAVKSYYFEDNAVLGIFHAPHTLDKTRETGAVSARQVKG
ncbi:hypothetical protein RLO149_c006050 [Roseobacter litoralis Och 149]|uniref:Uncharacterized protein n=1 Tax=Roseobacter litoralis (strain ATCC 49566 / DSM 6996 / JCM 21268 / NBRC 15278 / OCh 149) TaxID=391595 RepID=F7ZK10_ROSLO|nr:hypothetical protein RLO149_c006050 [Roseobacter litoralis Och 149]